MDIASKHTRHLRWVGQCGGLRFDSAWRSGRLIEAARVVCQRVAGCGVCASPAAATAGAILASAAASTETVGIAKSAEELVIPVDLHEVIVSDVAGNEWEKATGADVAEVVDEDEPVPVGDRAARPTDRRRRTRRA